MFCPKCGTENANMSSRCTSCGTHFTGAALRAGAVQMAQSGVLKGFFTLWLAWFTMPVKTIRLTAQQLREYGSVGALENGNDIPHLTWVRAAGGTLACIGIFVALIWGVWKGVEGLGDIRYDTSGALLGLVGYPLAGALAAIVIDWAIMTFFVEMLGLWVGVSDNIRRLAGGNRG
jgi:hypothetical protein